MSKSNRRRLKVVAGTIAVVATAVFAVSGGVNDLYDTVANVRDEPQQVVIVGTSPSATPETPTAPSSTIGSETVSLGCPAPPDASGTSVVQIRVVKWCADLAPRGQAYFKLQVWVTNTGNETLSIDLRRFYLLVDTTRMDRWSQPPGHESRNRPFLTEVDGQRVWAIPANPDGAAEPFALPGQPTAMTFATHWSGGSLEPGEAFTPRARHKADLVFYAPLARRGATSLPRVLGVAYVDGRDVIVACPKSHWGPRVGANDF